MDLITDVTLLRSDLRCKLKSVYVQSFTAGLRASMLRLKASFCFIVKYVLLLS